MTKQWVAAALLLMGTLTFADVKVIVSSEDDTENPAPAKQLTEEQKEQEVILRERVRQRDELLRKQQLEREKFHREQHLKHEAQERERKRRKEEWEHNLKK